MWGIEGPKMNCPVFEFDFKKLFGFNGVNFNLLEADGPHTIHFPVGNPVNHFFKIPGKNIAIYMNNCICFLGIAKIEE